MLVFQMLPCTGNSEVNKSSERPMVSRTDQPVVDVVVIDAKPTSRRSSAAGAHHVANGQHKSTSSSAASSKHKHGRPARPKLSIPSPKV